MNKIAIIALATLLMVGIGYQAKRSYDASHARNDSSQNSNPDSKTDASPTQIGTDQNVNSGDMKSNTAQTGTAEANTSSTIGTENNADTGSSVSAGNNANSSANAGSTGMAHSANGDIQNNDLAHATPLLNSQSGTSSAAAGRSLHKNENGSSAKGAANPKASGSLVGNKNTAKAEDDEDADVDSDQTAKDVAKKSAKTSTVKSKENCFAFEFRHKKDAGEQDIENFLDHTNAFPIAHADYNPKSLCVKVNQKAVSYQISKYKQSPEVRLGAMVGPESIIRVSYCVGKINPCHEKCEQPKKRFMDELMSENTDDDSFSDSWGKEGADKAKKDLKNKAKELRAIASENDHLNEGSIQRDWESLQKQEWVCK